MICLLTQINKNSMLEERLSDMIDRCSCLSYFLMILDKKSDKIIANVYCITGHKIMV